MDGGNFRLAALPFLPRFGFFFCRFPPEPSSTAPWP
jgi:hypothetical protein